MKKLFLVIIALIFSMSPAYADPSTEEMSNAFASYNNTHTDLACNIGFNATKQIQSKQRTDQFIYKMAAAGWKVCHDTLNEQNANRTARLYPYYMQKLICRAMNEKGYDTDFQGCDS